MGSLVTWFVYVGSCLATPDATCRPFLAFILMGAAASAALTLIIIGCRFAYARGMVEIDERRSNLRTPQGQARVHRAASGAAAPTVPLRRYRPVV